MGIEHQAPVRKVGFVSPVVKGDGFLGGVDAVWLVWPFLVNSGSSRSDPCVFTFGKISSIHCFTFVPDGKILAIGKREVVAAPDDLVLTDPKKFVKIFLCRDCLIPDLIIGVEHGISHIHSVSIYPIRRIDHGQIEMVVRILLHSGNAISVVNY